MATKSSAPQKKLAIITGASSGIGAAFATALAKDHTDIWLIGRREAELRKVAHQLEHPSSPSAHPIKTQIFLMDLSIQANIDDLAERLSREPKLFTLINNAGYAKDGPFHELPWQDHLDIMNVHVTATLKLTYAALNTMVKNQCGTVINVASVASWIPTPKSPLYGPTKAFIRSFSETLAADYGPKGIKIQGLCPGFTITDFHSRMGLDPNKAYKKSGLMKALSAEFTVRTSLRDLEKGRAVSVPGWNYKLITSLLRTTPVNLIGRLSYRRSPPRRN